MKDKIIKFLSHEIESIGFIPSMSAELVISISRLEECLSDLIEEDIVEKVIVPVVHSLEGSVIHEDLYSTNLNSKACDFTILNEIDYEPIDSEYI